MKIHYAKLSPTRPPWLGDGQWILSDLKAITVLFGKNGSGKSLLLRALDKKSEIKTFYCNPERAGNISYDQNIVQEELQIKSRGRQRKDRNQAARFRQESISRLGTLKMKIGEIAGRGNNVKAILSKIEKDLETLLPDFKFTINEEPPLFFCLERYDEGHGNLSIADPAKLSSGESEILTLAIDLLTICNLWKLEEQPQKLLLIDEPDVHLHPDLQVSFAEFIYNLANEHEAQVILATHSTTLLASLGHLGKDDVGVVHLNNSKGEQRITSFDKYLRKLTVCLGGHALMGPLFDAPLLLVEGDDEYQIWSQLPRNPNYRRTISIFPCDGEEIKTYQKTVESLFESLRSKVTKPAGFALLDGDKSMPTQQSQKHIKFLCLNCRESENLYITDEILNKLGYTWAEACEKIKSEADSHGKIAHRLTKCSAWDRKNVDLKGLMNSLSSILDPKDLLWSLRLGKILGARKPSGQLAEFLGDETVTSIWN